jgi:uncharacterized membrane protein
MNGKLLGALSGLVFGVVLFWKGFGEAVAVLLLVLLGWFVGKLASREVDVLSLLERISKRREPPDK